MANRRTYDRAPTSRDAPTSSDATASRDAGRDAPDGALAGVASDAQSGALSRPGVWMHPSDQAAAATLALAALVAIGMTWLVLGGGRGQLVDVDRVERRPLEFRLDVNQATWPELALLPGIGETLARKIVASREQDGAFREADDLLRVSGIGPKKLAALRPYLLPLQPAGFAAGSLHEGDTIAGG